MKMFSAKFNNYIRAKLLEKDSAQRSAMRFWTTAKAIHELRFYIDSMSHYRYRASVVRKVDFERYYQVIRIDTLFFLYGKRPRYIQICKGLAIQEFRRGSKHD